LHLGGTKHPQLKSFETGFSREPFMRLFLLLLLLVGVLGFAGYSARQRYATEKVKVPGSTRTYEIYRNPDQCWGEDCYLKLVFLTKGTDRAVWRAEAQELEPWLVAQARSGRQRGAILLAVRPGFAHLFPPTKLRYFVMSGPGIRWKILKEGDGAATGGITE
jgi:hypothetical protein